MLMIHLAATVLALQAAKAAPPAAAAVAATDVAVAISYTGKGTVDANHKVLAWLFADPNVTSNSPDSFHSGSFGHPALKGLV